VYVKVIMTKTARTTSCDIAVIGAGPAGLALARALKDSGLKVILCESSSAAELKSPKPDGRDIALTHLSRNLMTELGLWQKLPQKEINPLKQARVINGTSPYFLHFEKPDAPDATLGWLVPNYLIRSAAYAAVTACKNVEIKTDCPVKLVKTDADGATLTLEKGGQIRARLAVAADTRFSQTRRQVGIATRMRDFGRSVIVCRMSTQLSHQDIAYECFIDEQTLAVLPLAGRNCSVVVTLPSYEAARLQAMPPAEFAQYVEERFQSRVGKMKLTGERVLYPLVATYADKFYGERIALVGDAAVGMHPVTAHGFNFGLRGAVDLAQRIAAAADVGGDIGAKEILAAYSRQHRKATRPLYLATNGLVEIYTKDNLPARLLRRGLLHLGNALPPVKRILMSQLTELDAA
jgi:ubiquinone biosynthesis UbiH/UbiF/VisC/COQ6 family hydroxylase